MPVFFWWLEHNEAILSSLSHTLGPATPSSWALVLDFSGSLVRWPWPATTLSAAEIQFYQNIKRYSTPSGFLDLQFWGVVLYQKNHHSCQRLNAEFFKTFPFKAGTVPEPESRRFMAAVRRVRDTQPWGEVVPMGLSQWSPARGQRGVGSWWYRPDFKILKSSHTGLMMKWEVG